MVPRTRLRTVPLLPEISVRLADSSAGLFDGDDGSFRSDDRPPFWAFVWAGGQAVARHVLDHPDIVAGRRVLDVGAGCGIVAIAAARAGAAQVRAIDVDPAAVAAIVRNVRANDVTVLAEVGDASQLTPDEVDVLLAGDAFYTASSARIMLALGRRAVAAGADVLAGDARRGFLPERLFDRLAAYDIAVPAALEGTTRLTADVWRMRRR